MKLLVCRLVVAATMIFGAGCDNATGDRLSGADDPAVPAPTTTPATPDREINPGGPGFQAKSATQLKNSLIACLGPNATLVTADMIQLATADAGAADRSRFLTPDFKAGDDIIEVQRELFDGVESALKSGVRPDQISLEYVTALKNVANVAGARCAKGLTGAPELCACTTPAAAADMMTRCLSYVSPTSSAFQPVAQSLSTKCAAEPGVAVASLVASSAFAKFR